MSSKEIHTYQNSDRIFDFVYSQAMEAATNRGGICEGSKEKFLILGNPELDEAKIARNKVKNYVDAILYGNEPDFYFYADLVTNALSKIDNGFCFGNAQKLINVTIKFFYILTYNNEDVIIRNKFKNCHCPMDRKMIGKVARCYKNYLENNDCTIEEKDLFTIYVDDNGKPVNANSNVAIPQASITAWDSIAWTQIDDNTRYIYDNFQQMVKKLCEKEEEYIHPIEFDYKYWNKD